ncbi:MAG TPA: 5-(carboxyamino)imidazole ribonucleotide synthase [Roseiflexaceae bacterium]|nr:5-(carboxyamino)imidazole ribonucleotide synthase [Roseiflexaceae bacterium]
MLIGILGAGQLGRMLALAGYPLGMRFRFLDPVSSAPAGQLAEQLVAGYDDEAALTRFARGLDLVTYEFENVPVAAARFLERLATVFPPPAALEAAQDRLAEKTFFQRLGIPTPPFAAVDTRPALDAALAAIGLPAVLKTRRLGYDGKGQAVLRAPADVDEAWRTLGGQPLILEGFVDFARELSILAVRGQDGATACYPLVENQHRAGMLRRSLAPAPGVTPELQALAESYASRALDALGYVGVLAIELFETGEGRRIEDRDLAAAHPRSLVVNEMAPRVHNSGHWTIEGAATSQFENHLRAVAGLPLGATAPRGHAAMLNLIGATPDPAALLALPEAHLHLYGKAPRPGRKLGHVTLRADDPHTLAERLAQLEALL